MTLRELKDKVTEVFARSKPKDAEGNPITLTLSLIAAPIQRIEQPKGR
jgi:hypothetical protein